MSGLQASGAARQRGPADHRIRDQIIAAANKQFSRYGYGKTTVADLAKAIGFSKAYIYKFFDSKRAIGQAICSHCLGKVTEAIYESLAEGTSATDKLRRFFSGISAMTTKIAFNDRKLYEIVSCAYAEKWPSAMAYRDKAASILGDIIQEGRRCGEFERKTPIDEVVRSIMLAFQPFMNPVMLQYNLDDVPEGVNEVTSLILRSLAP